MNECIQCKDRPVKRGSDRCISCLYDNSLRMCKLETMVEEQKVVIDKLIDEIEHLKEEILEIKYDALEIRRQPPIYQVRNEPKKTFLSEQQTKIYKNSGCCSPQRIYTNPITITTPTVNYQYN